MDGYSEADLADLEELKELEKQEAAATEKIRALLEGGARSSPVELDSPTTNLSMGSVFTDGGASKNAPHASTSSLSDLTMTSLTG